MFARARKIGVGAAIFAALIVCTSAPFAQSQGLSTSGTAPAAESDRGPLRQFLTETIDSASSFEDRFEAEVWLVDMQARLALFIDQETERLALLRQIHHAATESRLPPELVLSVIEVESSFDRFAVSRAGALGYMQVMPFWRNEIGRPKDNLIDTVTNLNYGCRILQFYLQREKGNLHRALAAYNGSLGSRRYSDKVHRAWAGRWRTTNLDW